MAQRTIEWWGRQGDQIAKARGKRIAMACEWIARSTKAITLSAAQIDLAEKRTISQHRMKRFGPGSLMAGREDQWVEQTAAIRRCLYADQDPAELPDVGWSDEEGRAALKQAQEALA
jgi:hypothetical protein